ncbi:hypothetical protein BC827DRAFT_1272185 [Russula dissimulans]|nr:hypothetical protein BC827DRAFT_1272185 [Russula dissimulans]
MTNYNDPLVLEADFWALVKFWHALDGLYIWEFVTTLDYEWSVIQKRRPYRWTIWLYSITRVSTLVALIINMIGFDVDRQINCQLWVIFELIFSYLAFASASLLIVLRVIAVWNRNKIVSVISLAIWATNVGFLIHGEHHKGELSIPPTCILDHLGLTPYPQLQGVWSPLTSTCLVPNTTASELNIIVSLITDTLLLIIMLIGLFRWRLEEGNTSSFGRLLWTQGIIWLFLATIAYVPPVVVIALDLNAPFNLMFQTPALITMSIAATRLYRSLSDFNNRGSSISSDFQKSGSSTTETHPHIRVAPIPLNRMEVSMVTSSEQYPVTQTGHYGSFVITEEQLRDKDKPQGLSVEDDVESGRGVEK